METKWKQNGSKDKNRTAGNSSPLLLNSSFLLRLAAVFNHKLSKHLLCSD